MVADRFSLLNAQDLAAFRDLLGEAYVLQDEDSLADYSHDYTEDLHYRPQLVLKPGNASEIAAVLGYCQERRIPVTPAGARTGLSGGMLPIYGGVVLATDRLNQILDIDTRNLQVTTQPAVVVQALQEAVAEYGLFYPVDPASRGSCYIGGNIAEGAGGLRAVKYGITKDYVLDLEVVLPTGEIIQTGARTLKNSTGYNLTQLMVGSEGTLGVVTRATLKLVPLPQKRMVMLAPFSSAERACDAVSAIFRAGIVPSALEFMEKEAIDFAQDFLGSYPFDTEGIEAHLLIEVDGKDADSVMADCEAIYAVLEAFDCGEILFAESEEEQNRLWKVRRTIGEATRSGHVVKEEDTVVPRAELAKLWKHIKAVAARFGISAFCFGHAGDGNLHVHLQRPQGQQLDEWEQVIEEAVREIFRGTVALGGTLSGEHGIGLVQKDYMDIAFSPVELALMRGIKRLFDPNGVLNPGKMFPEVSPE
ncbi:MAG: FAD-linked oxidase C-terminal domain-containing protein [Bacteroidota bacterium]